MFSRLTSGKVPASSICLFVNSIGSGDCDDSLTKGLE